MGLEVINARWLGMDASGAALLIVDLQRDFLPGGALPVTGGDTIVGPICAIAQRFDTVVATQDFHPVGHVSFASSHPGKRIHDVIQVSGHSQVLWPDHCMAGSRGAGLVEGFPDHRTTLILRKGTHRDVDSYSAFCEDSNAQGLRSSTGLDAWLRARGIRRVYIVGLARDYCVRASALDAAAERFETFVVDDLTRAVFPERAAEVDEEFRRVGVTRVIAGELI